MCSDVTRRPTTPGESTEHRGATALVTAHATPTLTKQAEPSDECIGAPNVELSGLPQASPLERRVRRSSVANRRATCRDDFARQTMLALKTCANSCDNRSAANGERRIRARRCNGSLRAEGRAARHGLAAALCERTRSDGKANEWVHEDQIMYLPNVGIERLPEAVRSNDGLDAPRH